MSLDPTTGRLSGTLPADASAGSPYSVTVTATDPHGATSSQTFTWHVTNPAPVAADDALAGLENALVSGNVLANDSDPDHDPLVVSAVNGVAGQVGMAVAGSAGGTFTVSSDGNVVFDPGADFDFLAVGQTRVTTVTYTVSDDGGGSDVAVVTVTVTGANDAPVGTPIPAPTNDDAEAVSLDVAGYFSDPDSTDLLTFTATGLPPGLSLDPVTGRISGTLAGSASAASPYSVTITATDPSGADIFADGRLDRPQPGAGGCRRRVGDVRRRVRRRERAGQ